MIGMTFQAAKGGFFDHEKVKRSDRTPAGFLLFALAIRKWRGFMSHRLC